MKIESLLKPWLLAACLAAAPLCAHAGVQVLATIGGLQVTADDLNTALGSSPFATQATSMSERDQAGLRGDMLRRLVAARLLALEAQRLGLDKTGAFRQDIEGFRLGLLYSFYMDKLRERIAVPTDTLDAMKRQFKGDVDGLAAAKAAYISEQYKPLKLAALQNLLQQDNIKLYEARIKPGVKADTVLMEGKSFQIKYGDIVDRKQYPALPNPEWVKEQLYKRGELLLVARAADKEGVDVSAKLAQYRAERLPAAMMDEQTRKWVADEKTLRRWFDKHPEVAQVAERRHVGQLVLAGRKEAEAMRARIVAGESLFALAGQFSIDPVGRKQNGDMGWMAAGRGMPELEKALATLQDGQLSTVIETREGFHLLTVLERKPGERKSYAEVRDRVRQLIINEQLPPYLGELERRYKVSWNVIQSGDGAAK